ncbi:MAG: hypothetical protein ACYTGH_15950 [Planctomycetota bacterium]|jgi:ribosomal protein L7/L12
MGTDVQQQILDALRVGHRIEAIRMLRQETGLSLADAKREIEEIERGIPKAERGMDPELLDEATDAILEGRTIDAVRALRPLGNLGMKDARLFTEEIDVEGGREAVREQIEVLLPTYREQIRNAPPALEECSGRIPVAVHVWIEMLLSMGLFMGGGLFAMFFLVGRKDLPLPSEVCFFALPILGVITAKIISRCVLTPRCQVEGCGGACKKIGSRPISYSNPDTPWLQKPEWADGRIKSSGKGTLWGIFLFTLIWNAISAPVLFAVPSEMEKGNTAILIGLLFPLIGFVMIGYLIREVIRWRKYGQSVFEITPLPGVLGGPLSGVIYTGVNVVPEDGFHLHLRCARTVTTGSGKNRSTSERTLWDHEMTVDRDLLVDDPTRSAIPILFALPYDQPESSLSTEGSPVAWKLKVSAATPGVDYEAEFEVPVFKTAESTPDFALEEGMLDGVAHEASADDRLVKDGVIRELLSDGVRYRFPMGRHVGRSLGLTLFFLIWTGGCVGLVLSDAPLIFKIVFPLVDLFLLYGTLLCWFDSRVITVRRGVLIASGGLFGIGAEKRFPVDTIKSIRSTVGSQSGNTAYHRIVLKTTRDKKHVLAGGLLDKTLADRVMDDLTA